MGKRTKKTGASQLNNRIKLVIKSGKYVMGWNEVIRNIRLGNSKVVLMANNTPGLRRSELEYYCMLGNVPIIKYQGTNNDLGRACGKLFSASVMSVLSAGDSDIVKAVNDRRKKRRLGRRRRNDALRRDVKAGKSKYAMAVAAKAAERAAALQY